MAVVFGRLPHVREYWPLVPLCTGVFVAAADQTVVVTVLPEMLLDLRVPVSDLDRASWTVTAYLIGYGAAMPLMGRLADRYGWPAVFVLAMALLAAGSAFVAVSDRLPEGLGLRGQELRWAVAARVVQAAGGGAAIPIALAAAAGFGTARRQSLLFGLIGASAEAGGVVGPLWGGLVGHFWSWRWVFWMNIPIAVLLAVAVVPLWRRDRTAHTRARIDFVGGALAGLALTLVTWALVDAAAPGTRTALLVVSAAGTGAAALLWVRRSASPIVPRGLFRVRSFAWASATHVLVGACLIIAMVTVPLMANTVLGATALEGGLRLLRLTLAVAAGAVAGGAIAGRAGGRIPALAGLSLVAGGLFLMSRWDIAAAEPWTTVHLAMAGAGFGLLIAPVVGSGLRGIPAQHRATAASWVTLSRMLGMALGLAAMTAWGTARFRGLVADVPLFGAGLEVLVGERAASAGMAVFRGFFAAGAACAIAGMVPAWMMTRDERRASPAHPASKRERPMQEPG